MMLPLLKTKLKLLKNWVHKILVQAKETKDNSAAEKAMYEIIDEVGPDETYSEPTT